MGAEARRFAREAAVGLEAAHESWEDLYTAELAPMMRLAYLLTGSAEIAEDLVHDSFLRMQKHAASVRNPGAYLRTTVLNACRQHHRRISRERKHFADLVPTQVSPETPVVLDALARLPHRQRAALVLRFYEDRPDAEIAELLGCRPATVRSLIHRGLAALRKVVEP